MSAAGSPSVSPPAAAVAPARPARAGLGSFGRSLALIVAGGVLLRVLYTVLAAPWPPPGLDDQEFFHLMPRVLADGHGFIQPTFFIVHRTLVTAQHPPLYPLVLAVPALVGLDGALFQRLCGTLFGAVTIVCIALIARRLAGDRAGLAAGGIAAVYPILITADGALMSESLYGALVGLTVLAAFRLRDAPTLGRGALAGAVCGLAALTRGEAILLLPLLLLGVVRRPGGPRVAAVALVAMVVVLTPWTVRNAIQFHRFVLVSTDAGAVVGGANCATTYGGSNIGGWDIRCDKPYPGNEAVQTSRQQSDGIHYALHHASRLPKVAVARELRQWGFFLPFQANPGRARWAQTAGTVVYWLLLPLAAAGVVVLRRRGMGTWLVLAPIALAAIQALVIYGFLRFRHPAELSIVALAGVAVDAALRRRAAPIPTPTAPMAA